MLIASHDKSLIDELKAQLSHDFDFFPFILTFFNFYYNFLIFRYF
jgi:hypothetical protein